MKPCSTSGITLGKAHKIKGFRDRKLCSRKPYKLVSHTPKRKAVCSNHIGDASALSRKVSHEIFRVFANKKEI